MDCHISKRRPLLVLLGLSCVLFLPASLSTGAAQAQTEEDHRATHNQHKSILQHAVDIQRTMAYLGSPLSAKDSETIGRLCRQTFPQGTVLDTVRHTLDPYCIAVIELAPDRTVTVSTAARKLTLQQSGWTSYLTRIGRGPVSSCVLPRATSRSVSPTCRAVHFHR